jgi:hypothetical protein
LATHRTNERFARGRIGKQRASQNVVAWPVVQQLLVFSRAQVTIEFHLIR